MRLYIENGKAFFDYEGERSDIFSYSDFGFKYMGGGIREFIPTGDAEEDCNLFDLAYYNCTHDNVTIGEGVEQMMKTYINKAEEVRQARAEAYRKEQEAEKRRAKWQSVQRHGCLYCKNLKRWNDDYVCAYAKKVLDERNVPKYDCNGVYHPFAPEPFPCEGCQYQCEEKII